MTKKVRVLSMLLAFGLMIMSVGCAKKVAEAEVLNNEEVTVSLEEDSRFGGSLVVATKGAPPHLDGDKSTMWTITETMNHVYEGLFEFDENQKATPFLAESYELSDDNKTYNVILRKGVLFHNGKEMTTEDVEASFNRWIANNAGGQMVGEYLEAVEVKGPYEISFTFRVPYAPFLNILASEVSSQKFVVRTKEMIEKYGDEIIQEHIGTGLYKLDEFVPDQYLKLSRFDDYVANEGEQSLFAGQRVAYLDDITFKYVSDPMVRFAGIQTGEFHFAEEIPQDQYPMFESNTDIEPIILDNDMMGMLAMNLGVEPFNDVNARRAVAYALDMKELGKVAIGDEKFWSVNSGGSMFPQNSVWFDSDSGDGIHDSGNIEKAKEYLEKSTYDGSPIIIVNTKDDAVDSQAAMSIKDQLEKAGFTVDVQLFDRATVGEKIFADPEKSEWNMTFSQWKEASPDPQVFGAWIGTNGWISNWDDDESKKMDEIFERMLIETNFDNRYLIVKEWNEKVWEQVPMIRTISYSRIHLKSSALKGNANYCKQMYWNTWLENN